MPTLTDDQPLPADVLATRTTNHLPGPRPAPTAEHLPAARCGLPAEPDQRAAGAGGQHTRAVPAALSDAELLPALVACSEAAWREAVVRYHRLVHGAVRRVLSCQIDIDEAVQRTWMAFWRNAGTIREAEKIPGWLAITARREALSVVRNRVRETPVDDLGTAQPRLEHDVFAVDITLVVEENERAGYLRAAVARLPERQRELITALLADRLSYDELSESLGIPRGSIGPMRARALKALRGMLQVLEENDE